jgi:very-short-patch-repair endonuclease
MSKQVEQLNDFPVIHKRDLRSETSETTTGGVPRDELGMTPIERRFWDAVQSTDVVYNGDPDFAEADIIKFPRTNIDDLRIFLVQRGRSIGSYRPDFVASIACGDYSCSVIVECDGHEFHDRTKDQVSKDKARDRQLLAFAPTMRFSGSDIYRDAYQCWVEVAVFLARRAIAGVREKRISYLEGLFRPWWQPLALKGENRHEAACLVSILTTELAYQQTCSTMTISVERLNQLGFTEGSFACVMSRAKGLLSWTYNPSGFCRFTLAHPLDPIPSAALHLAGEDAPALHRIRHAS